MIIIIKNEKKYLYKLYTNKMNYIIYKIKAIRNNYVSLYGYYVDYVNAKTINDIINKYSDFKICSIYLYPYQQFKYLS